MFLEISQYKGTKNSLIRASIYGNMHRNLTFYMSFCRFSYSAVIYDLLYSNLAVFHFNLQSFEVVQFLDENHNLILRFPYEMEPQLTCITVTENLTPDSMQLIEVASHRAARCQRQ